jgi:hypothetical protein
MKTLRIGKTGPDVRNWQFFLAGQGLYHGPIDGVFDETTKNASQVFQKLSHLKPNGKVGNKTIGAAVRQGFWLFAWPPKPSFPPLLKDDERWDVFGKFSFRSEPIEGNEERIVVTDNWVEENIVIVNIPQLVNINGSPEVAFHIKAKTQLAQLWSDWERASLINRVLTFGGSYDPRFMRETKSRRKGIHKRLLSNHAFGTAFDINCEWNKFGDFPKLANEGSVIELVKIANDNGFYWGGHFPYPYWDGMHFEVAILMSPRKKDLSQWQEEDLTPHWRKKKSRVIQESAAPAISQIQCEGTLPDVKHSRFRAFRKEEY